MTNQKIDDTGALVTALPTHQMTSEALITVSGSGTWESATVNFNHYWIIEVTLVTHSSGHFYMKSSGGWWFDGTYGDQGNFCGNFAFSIGANTWGEFHLKGYDQVKLHIFKKANNDFAGYFHNSGYGNYLGDAWLRISGGSIQFKHDRNTWFGVHAVGYK